MSDTTYTQYYSNFLGVDMSSDPRAVSRNRLAYSVNMWRDYESEQGAAIETFPGFRVIGSKIRNESVYEDLWHYKGGINEYFIIRSSNVLIAVKVNESMVMLSTKELYLSFNPKNATGFTLNNSLYIVLSHPSESGNQGLVRVYEDDNGIVTLTQITDFYVPTTYYNGKTYEQRNALTSIVKQVETDGGSDYTYEFEYTDSDGEKQKSSISCESFELCEQCAYAEDSEHNWFLRIISVKVDGKELKHYTEGTFAGDNYLEFYRGKECLDMRAYKIIIPKETIRDEAAIYKVEIEYYVEPTHFNTIGNLKFFQDDCITMADAILGCTKSAVYDGRVFLTGNPSLPNTVFYSQRNLTGANDPTYFGVYNYFNDGDGNTPNVDLLAMPSMLMVIKSDTVQDGSVYYHVGADNTDDETKDLMPRLYPSTKGAAGLGSAGDTTSHSLSCNFLDDPVFLSKRGLEAVGKENVSLERTLVHRSSNIDRLLLREDLAHASLAEWKGYLVICCNGHIYLADSRRLSQHPDGSYQYEWFYLEGVGTYEEYRDAFYKIGEWPVIDGKSLETILEESGQEIYLWDEKEISLGNDGGRIPTEDIFMDGYINSVYCGGVEVYYAYDENTKTKKLVETRGSEKVGYGFCGARRVLAIGDLLIFATDYEICIFNTDRRGADILDENGEIIRRVDEDKIDSSYYTFGGVRYLSACATRLDDCDKKSVTKNTLYGTTSARLKMMPGAHCKIRSSANGRDWEDVGETSSTRTDFSDMSFDSFSFAENENDVLVLPELSRGWVDKQYYFYSDGFCEPFGLYELSYVYRIAGKIRYY